MMDERDYGAALSAELLGRRPREGAVETSRWGRTMLSFMGADLGFSSGDVHQNRSYRVYLTLDGAGRITGVETAVDGDLISPCSGYFPEALDRFDYPAVRKYCLARMDDSRAL